MVQWSKDKDSIDWFKVLDSYFSKDLITLTKELDADIKNKTLELSNKVKARRELDARMEELAAQREAEYN